MDIEQYIHLFFNKVENNAVTIYNEFSLQHELGIFLRNIIPKPMKVEFERNINIFYDEKVCVKSEIDIVIYSEHNEKYAIELKFPRNGQYPESMFQFIKDIRFMEQIKELGFTNTFVITYVKDKLFYSGVKRNGIYSYFRDGKTLSGKIIKPTGKKNETLNIQGRYKINWHNMKNEGSYYLLSI